MKNIINFDDFINESLSSDNDLNIIADALISKASNKIIEHFDNRRKSELPNLYNTDNFIYIIFRNIVIEYNDFKYSKKLSKEFLRIFKQSESIYLNFSPKYETTKAEFYDENCIKLYISYKDKDKEYLRKMLYDKPTSYNLTEFFIDYKPSIIHELQHYIDYWRSLSTNKNSIYVNKYIDKNAYAKDDKGKIDYDIRNRLNHENTEDFEKYLKFSHEISARYTQTLNDLTSKKSYKDFNDLLKDFKNKFLGWNIIKDSERQRLIKRLSQYFFSIYKDKSKQDITEILKDFSEKNNVYVNFTKKHIDLYDNDIYKKDYKKIIPMLIKISNIYRYDITVYPSNKEFGIYLKSIGFVANKGKNIDFSKRWDEYIYKSKR